ncbi:MAG: hypothetical protein U0T78_06545 [Cloacibacterium normanense]
MPSSVQKLPPINLHGIITLKYLLKQHFLAIIFLLILSGYAAWYISKGITKKIANISKTLQKTNVEYLETPIEYSDRDEIKTVSRFIQYHAGEIARANQHSSQNREGRSMERYGKTDCP